MNLRHFSTWLGLLAISVFVSGCAGPKALSTVDRNSVGAITFDSPVKSPSTPSVVTITGRRASEAGAGGGLIGAIVGVTTAKVSAADEKKMLSSIREQTGDFEADSFKKNIEQQLQADDFTTLTNLATANILALEISSFGLSEISGGRYAPVLFARASLKEPDGKKLWSASASSVGERSHTMDEYLQRPALYQETFQEVTADVAKQLITGPIRPPSR